MKQTLKKNYKLILFCFALAVIGHAFFLINQLLYDQYMMSPADQFSQMIIFKDLLYDEFSQGNFFYSFFLNGGSNLISRLSYYYSTSLMFYGTVLVTFFLEMFSLLQSPNMVYWASTFVFISIVRSFIILIVTTKYINQFTNNQKISLLGATFYAFSTIYFRHVALWEFFADAMIWLPIILLGVEYIIRKNEGKIFAVGIALTMFNNGYFAFANLLFTLVYIVLCFIFKLHSKEESVYQQLKNYVVYGLLGVSLSLPGFIPFVQGFFNTSRLSPEFSIPAFQLKDFEIGNLLLNDQIQVLPILFVFVIFYFINYKSRKFRFFSLLSFFLIILRYNPFVASLFNGLSYPQYRWHYMTFLMMAIVIAVGAQNIINHLNEKTKTSIFYMVVSFILTLAIYTIADRQLEQHYFSMEMVYMIILFIGILFMLFIFNKRATNYLALPLLFVSSLYTVFTTNEQLYDDYNLDQMGYGKIYETFDNPNIPIERALDIIEEESNRFYRIDFSDTRNLGSQKDFSTFNVYNSFQNHYQQYFYRYHQILNSRENNGTIDGLAGRQVLSSLFQSDYVIASERNHYIVPTGFEPIGEVNDLTVYKNKFPLAFIHPVDHLYSVEEVNSYVFKDELLVNGAIVPDQISNTSIKNSPKPNKLDYIISEVGTTIEKNKLLKSDDYFSIRLDLRNQNQDFDDVVIDYTIKPLDDGETGRYTYSINNQSIQLKSTGDPYSSQLYRHQAHIPYNDVITFTLAPGTDYIFEIHSIYGVSHDYLEERSNRDEELDYSVEINRGTIDIKFDNHQEYPLMVLPLFYENGWHLNINGETREVSNVNNGMVGFEIPKGEVNIHLTYQQPFLPITLLISMLSLVMLVCVKDLPK